MTVTALLREGYHKHVVNMSALGAISLAMRSAQARLLYDRSSKAIDEVQSLLWETARRIEDGSLPMAERRGISAEIASGKSSNR